MCDLGNMVMRGFVCSPAILTQHLCTTSSFLTQTYGTAVTSRASTSNMAPHTASNNSSSQQLRRGQTNVVDGAQHAAVTQIMSDIDFKVCFCVVLCRFVVG